MLQMGGLYQPSLGAIDSDLHPYTYLYIPPIQSLLLVRASMNKEAIPVWYLRLNRHSYRKSVYFNLFPPI